MQIIVAIVQIIIPSFQFHYVHDLNRDRDITMLQTHEEEMVRKDGEFIVHPGLYQLDDGRFDIIHFERYQHLSTAALRCMRRVCLVHIYIPVAYICYRCISCLFITELVRNISKHSVDDLGEYVASIFSVKDIVIVEVYSIDELITLGIIHAHL
jgi:hypothetical protein